MCGVCFVIICSLSFLLLVPREGCVRGNGNFLGIFVYFYINFCSLKIISYALLSSPKRGKGLRGWVGVGGRVGGGLNILGRFTAIFTMGETYVTSCLLICIRGLL